MKKKKLAAMLLLIFFLLLGGILTQNHTHYATINGESFSIPKTEGEGYYEKTDDATYTK